MGPGDPFANEPYEPVEDGEDAGLLRDTPAGRDGPTTSLNTALAAGLIAGLLFGLMVVFKGMLAAIVLAVFGLLGVGAAWAGWAIVHDRLDVRGALRVLLRR